MGQSRRGTDPIVVLPAEHAGAEPQGCVALTVFLGVEKNSAFHSEIYVINII
jgi:hypothetical protein